MLQLIITGKTRGSLNSAVIYLFRNANCWNPLSNQSCLLLWLVPLKVESS